MSASPMRIVSLLPAATEIVAAIGLADRLVGRSHECDEPKAVQALPMLTAPRIDPTLSSSGIHDQVEEASGPLFTLDIDRLAELEPDLVLTQAACAVCAIAEEDVVAAIRKSGVSAQVIALSPTTLDDMFRDILTVGAATGRREQAREVVTRLKRRCDAVAERGAGKTRQAEACPPFRGQAPPAGGGRPSDDQQGAAPSRASVAVIEWLDPPMAAGNWVPEMVRLAGGRDVLGKAGAHSHWIDWADVAAADPDMVVLIPCGFTLDRAVAEARSPAVWPHLTQLRAVWEGRAWVIDGHHLFNRPGPRLVDSLEVLAEVLHPEAFSFAATQRFAKRMPTTG
jgi:iron complex transport system substrate-binding protein